MPADEPHPEPANPSAALRRLGAVATLALLASATWNTLRTQPTQTAPVDAVIAYRLSINHAETEELAALPGVGPTVAKTIAQHRATHGPFRDIEDLTHVRGIGELTAHRIGQWVRFD